ncbi:hypothetical protein MTR67_038678 [Solanum verrucosum]|uniref:Uncharacterized protein n=1 Tax=Solanum verrucosum TaxID=315347 RepID=A0AAF0UFM0_SOLVR|nr:hypothetical protein MTR67_038678 [Solanum verrucosum]
MAGNLVLSSPLGPSAC